jgi:hypothetical protein
MLKPALTQPNSGRHMPSTDQVNPSHRVPQASPAHAEQTNAQSSLYPDPPQPMPNPAYATSCREQAMPSSACVSRADA